MGGGDENLTNYLAWPYLYANFYPFDPNLKACMVFLAIVLRYRDFSCTRPFAVGNGYFVYTMQVFKWAILFLLFPALLICSYLSLLFLKNALLSLLFYSQMSFTRKNTDFFLAR